MPRRLYIKDGGLTSSRPTPTGFTVFGALAGVPKKQVIDVIGDFGSASGGGAGEVLVGINQIAFGNSASGSITSDSTFTRAVNGNIGIGSPASSNPSARLDISHSQIDNFPLRAVSSNSTLTRFPLLNSGGVQTDLQIGNNNGSDSLYLGVLNTSIAYLDNRTSNRFEYRIVGDSKLVIDTSGNVGIGNNFTSPTAKLQVKGVGSSSDVWSLKIDDGSNNPLLYVSDGGNVGIGITNSSEILNIYKSGFNQANLLVESDSHYSTLVLNSFKNSQGTSGGSKIQFKAGGSTKVDMSFNSADDRLYLISSGGIVQQTAYGSTHLYRSYYSDLNLRADYGNVVIDTTNSGNVLINPVGNVGIGTASPSSKLHIKGSGNTSATNAMKIDNSNSSPLLYVRDDGVSVFTSAFDGVTAGNSNYSYQTTLGGLLVSYNAQDNTAFQFFKNSLLRATIINNDGYFSISPKYRMSLKTLDDNKSHIWFDSDGLVGIGNDYFSSTAQLHIKGTGTSSSTHSLKIDNNDNNPLLYVRDDGRVFIGKSIIANAPMEVGFGRDQYSTGFNTALGVNSLSSWNGAYSAGANIAVGYETLKNLTTGQYNVAVGYRALSEVITGQYNTSLNFSLISNLTGDYNVALGYGNLNTNTSSSTNIAIGRENLFSLTSGTNNIAISGYAGLYNLVTGSNNIVLGYLSLAYLSSGNSNTVVGNSSLSYNPFTGDNNTIIGQSNFNTLITNGSANTVIGRNIQSWTSSLSNNILIGDGSGNIRIMSDSNGNIGIGLTGPSSKLHIKGSTSDYTAYALKVDNSSSSALLYVRNDGSVWASGKGANVNNTVFGYNAGVSYTTGVNNTAYGNYALNACTEGNTNTAIGRWAMISLTTGNQNTSVGYNSLGGIVNGSNNIAIGVSALSVTNDGSHNTIIGGVGAFLSNVDGNYNTSLGSNTGYSNTSGSSNIFLGYSAGYYETGSNKLFIDNQTRVNEATARTNSMIYGVFNSTVSSQTLRVNGLFGVNVVPTAATHIQGFTSDNTAYALKVDNSSSSALLYVRNDGNVGIGTNSPSYLLDVNGIIRSYNGANYIYIAPSSTSQLQISSSDYSTLRIIGDSGLSDIQIVADNGFSYLQSNQVFYFTDGSSGSNAKTAWNPTTGNWLFTASGLAYGGAASNKKVVINGGNLLNTDYGLVIGGHNGVSDVNYFFARNDGNIGIGASGPSASLHIKGSTSDSTAYALKVDNSLSSALLYVRNDGNVGIGTASPVAILQINDPGVPDSSRKIFSIIDSLDSELISLNRITFSMSTANQRFYTLTGSLDVQYTMSSGAMTWYNTTYGSETLRLNLDASPIFSSSFQNAIRFDSLIGIGMTNSIPNYSLDVVGDINTSTLYRVGATAGWTGTFSADGQVVTVIGGIITQVV